MFLYLIFYNKSLLYYKTGCFNLNINIYHSTQNLLVMGMRKSPLHFLFSDFQSLKKKIGNGNLLQF